MIGKIGAAEAARRLEGGSEIAFIDVREIIPFGRGHPLLAGHLSLSDLENRVADVIPRRSVPVIVIDGGESHAARAATRLASFGYTDVQMIDGGTPAWKAAGLGLFPELEVPTKGFGAFARINGNPRFISPNDLKAALDSDEDWIVLDSRPRPEYQAGNIPGSIDAPGADVLRWFDDLVPNPKTKVCINCMSATRGILGGLSLVAAGVPNEVHVLHHGTRGWLLDGHDLERGAARFPGPVNEAAQAAARARAAELSARAGLKGIDRATLASWRADADRTTYLFDVRTPAEFEAGHLPGAVNAPEGAIVMSPDKYFATLNARIVLCDDDTVRATVTALWLSQMGWGEVAFLTDGLSGDDLETGPARGTAPPAPEAETVDPADLDRRVQSGTARVIDVGPSDAFVSAHIPAAVWCLRDRLPEIAAEAESAIVLTSPDGRAARFAADDIRRDGGKAPLVLAGGTAAWRAAGLPLESGDANLLSPRDDFWLASSERPGDQRRNVQDYLDWETTLMDDIERAGEVRYRNLIWN